MANEQFVEVTYGPVRLVPESAPGEPPKPPPAPKRQYLKKANEWMQFLRSLFVNALFIVPLVTIGLLIVGELRKAPVVIEEIGLPKSLSDRGFTGAVAAHRLWDAMSTIQRKATTEKASVSLLPDSRQLDVVEPGTGLSLLSLAQMLRASFDLEQTRITGEFLCADTACEPEGLQLRLRVFTGDSMEIRNIGQLEGMSLDAYFLKAAERAMDIVDPYVLASYYYDDPETRPEALKIARELVEENHRSAPWGAILIGFHDGGNDPQTLKETETLFKEVYQTREQYGKELPAAFWLNWGTTLENLGEAEEAINKHKRATEIDSNYAFAWVGWGVSLGDLNDHEGAIEKYRRATEIDPDFSTAWINWAVSLGQQGKHDQAIEKYEQATLVDPDNANAWYGWGFSLLPSPGYRDAIEKFEKATSLDPQLVSAWYYWGVVLASLKSFDEAAEKFESATRADPEHYQAWHKWGDVLGKLERHEEAEERFSRAIQIDPAKPKAWITWGEGLNTQGRHDAAIEKLQRAVELEPDNKSAWNTWAKSVQEWHAKTFDCAPVRAYRVAAVKREQGWALDELSGISDTCQSEQRSMVDKDLATGQ